MPFAIVSARSLIAAATELLGAPPDQVTPKLFAWDAVPLTSSTEVVLGLGPGQPSVAFTALEDNLVHASVRDGEGVQTRHELITPS